MKTSKSLFITSLFLFVISLTTGCQSSSNNDFSFSHTHIPNEPVKENIIEPTCTNEGSYEEVIYCKECQSEISRTSKKIDVLGHDFINHEGKEATCTEKGYIPYQTCSRCDYTSYQEIEATGHINTSTRKENIIEPTCTNEGSYDLITYCLDDGVILSTDHINSDALGHDYSSWETIKESNDYQDGLRQRKCSRCQNIEEEIVPTSSPFTFILNNDKESYTVTGYEPKDGFKGEDIIIPETFNGLKVSVIGQNNGFFIIKTNPTADISKTRYVISNKNIKINELTSVYQSEETRNRDYNRITRAFDTYPYMTEIFYKGSLNDWISNTPLANGEAIPNHPGYTNYLYVYNDITDSYEKVVDVTIPDGIVELPRYCFSNISFKSLLCPSSLKSFGTSSVNYNRELESVSFNEGLESFGTNNFLGCTKLTAITVPSSYKRKASISFDSLLSLHIKKGASNYQSLLQTNDRLIKVIDENDDVTYLNDKDFINKENENQSALFDYQGFKVAKIINKIYLISYFGDSDDGVLHIPEKIVYENQEYSDIYLGKSFLQMARATGLNASPEEIISAYHDSYEEIKRYSKDFLFKDLFFTLHIPKNIKMHESALTYLPYTKDIYFDGNYEEWKTSIGPNVGKALYNFSQLGSTSVVHILEGERYVDHPIIPISE